MAVRKRFTEQDIRDALVWDNFADALINEGNVDPFDYMTDDEVRKAFVQLGQGYIMLRYAYLASPSKDRVKGHEATYESDGKRWRLVPRKETALG